MVEKKIYIIKENIEEGYAGCIGTLIMLPIWLCFKIVFAVFFLFLEYICRLLKYIISLLFRLLLYIGRLPVKMFRYIWVLLFRKRKRCNVQPSHQNISQEKTEYCEVELGNEILNFEIKY